jgi:hypothetical protein
MAVPKIRTKPARPYGLSDKEGIAVVKAARSSSDKHGFTSTAPKFDEKPQPAKGAKQ